MMRQLTNNLHDVDDAQAWLDKMRIECSLMLLRVANNDIDPDLNRRLQEAWSNPVPFCKIVHHIKNYTSSLVCLNPNILVANRTLQNHMIERLILVIKMIREHEWTMNDFTATYPIEDLSPDAPEFLQRA